MVSSLENQAFDTQIILYIIYNDSLRFDMLYDYLVSHYKKGEPIFIEDIHIEGMNRPNFCQQLKTLTDNGKLKRYEKGIYYLPKETLLKAASGPSSETIAKYKYISRNGITNGFFFRQHLCK